MSENGGRGTFNARRVAKLQRIQKRIDDLRSRGLLKKHEYVSVSTAEFERKYFNADRS